MSLDKVRKLRAIMFADIQGYTAMMQENEQIASKWLTTFKSKLEEKSKEFDGKIINFFGDGCLCIFESSVRAVSCARELQKVFGSDLPVRIGLHSGDVYFSEDTVYGDAVNIASRIESISIPSAVLFSKRISRDIKNQFSFNFTPLGVFEFKNVAEPIEVFALVDTGLVIPTAQEIKGKLAKKKSGKVKSTLKLAGLAALFLVLFLLFKSDLFDRFVNQNGSLNNDAIAVLDFKNQTNDATVDVLGKMAADRLVHGITANSLGRVITGESINEFDEIMKASLAPIDQLDFLKENFAVGRLIQGNIYSEGNNLIIECTITDANSKEVIVALPAIKCLKSNPGPCIEDLKQLLLGALVSESDKDKNLLLETSAPKFEAFRELTLAKEAETDEQMIIHLDRAIAVDSTYFEPLVLRLSGYYNLNQYTIADSLLKEIDETLWRTDPRQKNLLSFYEALLKGQNNLIFKHMYEELKLAPFDLMTNNTVMVLALQFTYDLQKAAEVYQEIPDANFDYANCSRCRTRLYLKMYLDLENEKLNEAVEDGKILLMNRGWNWAEDLLIRAYVKIQDWESLEELRSFAPGGKLEDPARHFLTIAQECLMEGHEAKSDEYTNLALSSINDNTTQRTIGDIYLVNNQADNAINTFQKMASQDSLDHIIWGRLAVAYAYKGNILKTEEIINYMEGLRGPFQFGDVDYEIARVRIAQNDTAKTLYRLQQSVNQGRFYYFHAFHNDFRFRTISDSDTFRNLLKHWR